MAGNGFKSPAPVLPAMGLHSFHNDSPPFAAAGEHNQEQPGHFSLDAAALHTQQSPSNQIPPVHRPVMQSQQSQTHRGSDIILESPKGQPSAGPSLTTTSSASSAASGSSAPIAITQRGFVPQTQPQSQVVLDNANPYGQRGDSASLDDGLEMEDTRRHQRVPTSEDDELSSSRSRTLLSGYMFGHPTSPGASMPSSPTKQNASLMERLLDDKAGMSAVHVPPSQPRDSPPISDSEDLGEEVDGDMDGDDTATISPIPRNIAGVVQGLNDNLSTPVQAKLSQPGQSNQQRSRKMSTRTRDKETGYDALNGLNDGEADLDESAPQAAFGSELYMKGEAEYKFPQHRLRKTMKDESKIPLVIVACGSFSPPTYLHLRMFEMAKDEILESQTYEIMAGYYSPVSSYYKKAGLAPAIHRVRMCELAVEHTSTWLMVDPWEAGQPEYQRTAVVLEHFNEMLNVQGGGLVMSDGKRRKLKVMLLAGGDLIESFGEPGVWSEPDLHIILGRFGCLIVERAGSDVWAFLLSHDILYHHRRNVIVIKQLIYNDISSTKVRLFVRRGMSIKYLLPNSVIQYIYDHKLYRGLDAKAITK